MFGEGLAACLFGAIGWRRPPPEPPKAVLRKRARFRRFADGAALGFPAPPPKPSAPAPPDRPAIDSNPIDSRRDNRLRPVAEHVEHVLNCFRHSAWRPGEAVDYEDMKAIYAHICRETGWRPHKWNTFAAALRRRMARGPRGGRKPYRKELRDGIEESIPIYILPDWTADRQSTPRRQDANQQSTPERQRRAA